jgi:hypothetical protein
MNIEKVLPGIGFIGCGSTSCISIKHDTSKKLRKLHLELNSLKPVDLNLKQIKFYDEHGHLIKYQENDVECTQSSWYLDRKKNSFNLLMAKTIHTAKENNPSWGIHFPVAQKISKIVIENRRSKLGLRTNSLKVFAQYENFSKGAMLYDNMSLTRLSEFFELLRVLDIHFDIALPINDEKKRLMLIRLIVDALLKHKDDFLKLNLKAANYLLNFWNRKKNKFYVEEIQLISLILLRDQNTRHAAKSYATILNKKHALNQCQQLLAEYGQILFNAEFILTKHGLSRNVLQENSDKFIRAALKLSNDLTVLGYPNLLCYGTLLGAYRDNDFIKNDDDLDMLYVTQANSQSDILPAVEALKSKLEDQGYSCDIRDTNMHVMHKDMRAQLDIFPCWIEGEKLHLHMENMKYRSIPKSLIFPLKKLKFKGFEFNCPNNCEGFFQERYHDGWNVYDPYHEWPWVLKD